jgi:hypothetical protein
MIGVVIARTREVDPLLWRRALALVLDGLRPRATTPLPAPPPSMEDFTQVLRRESGPGVEGPGGSRSGRLIGGRVRSSRRDGMRWS